MSDVSEDNNFEVTTGAKTETWELLEAAESSLAFWDNPIDDEVWNNA